MTSPKRTGAWKTLMGALVACLAITGTPQITNAQQAAASNSVETIITDMTQKNDLALSENPNDPKHFFGPGTLVMGNDSRGTNTPDSFQEKMTSSKYIDEEHWKVINPWLQILTHSSSQAGNTQVEMGNIKLNILRKSTGTWETIQDTGVDGEMYPLHARGADTYKSDIWDTQNGTKQVTPDDADSSHMFHGWGQPLEFDTSDIQAVHVTVDARLAKKDPAGADDRNSARYLLQTGADYYPEKGARLPDDLTMQMGHTEPIPFPGVGISRAKLITNEWQSFNFATILDEEGKITVEGQNKNAGITVEELKKNPPPLS